MDSKFYIDAELEKDPEERDYDLIEECSEFEAELPEMDIELSKSEYVAGLERIKAKTSVTEHKEAKILKNKKKTKKSVRIIAILVASIATLLLSLTVAASVQGKPVMQFISENIKIMLSMDTGDKLEEEGITLVKCGKSMEYNSLEEAVKATGYDILYPSYLPKEVNIERIVMAEVDSNGAMAISYVTNNADISISISLNFNLNYPNWDNSIVYSNAIMEFYIVDLEGEFQAVGLYNNMKYSIKYNNYDELINILNGIKEIEK